LRGGRTTGGIEEGDMETGGVEEGRARRTTIEELAVGGTEAGGGEGEGRGAGRLADRREILVELTPGFDLLWRAGTFPYMHLCLSFKHIMQRYPSA
jgi:hypothetical protein